MIGKIPEHCRLLEKLGKGGMGAVYRAQDKHLGRSVAIRILPAGKVSHPHRKARFVQEIRAASALNHRNMCESTDGKSPYCWNGISPRSLWRVPVDIPLVRLFCGIEKRVAYDRQGK
jgi:serine/threonine protein kinase